MAGFAAEIKLNLDISDVLAQIDVVEARLEAAKREQVQAAQAVVPGLTPAAQSSQADYAAATARLVEAQTARDAVLDTAAKVGGEGYVEAGALAREAATKLVAAAEQSVINSGSPELIAANAELATARRLEAATTRLATNNVALGSSAISPGAVLSTEETTQPVAERAAQTESLARITGQILAAEATLLDQVNIETVGRESFNTKLAEASVAELRAKAELALTTQNAIFAQNEADKAAGIDTVPQLQAATAYEQQFATLEQKNALLRLQLDSEESLVSLQNENVVLQAQYNLAKKAQTEAALAAARATGALPVEEAAAGATRSAGGGILSSGLAGLGKFALGAAAFVGITAGVRDVLKETTALQQQFSILKVQLDQTDNAGQFPQLKQGLFDISRDTGVATSDLAKLAIQIQGTFQGQAGRDSPNFILAQVHSAAEIQKVFGLSFQEIGNSVQALSFTFNKSFQDIGDRAAGLQSRFGVTAKELISSVSQIAPVAHELGLNFNQLTAITAAAERETGRTGVSVTEALGRVLPNIAQHTQDVLAVYQGNRNLAGSYSKIVEDLASGRTGDVLLQLIQDWSKLSQVQRDSLLVNLGGGRQAPQLAAVFGDPQLLKELNKPIDDTGKLNAQFKSLKDTLGQALSEIKQALLQIGVTLANLGIVQAFEDLATALRVIVGIAGPFVGVISSIDNAIGGLASKITGLVIALKLLQVAANSSLIGGLLAKIGIGGAAAEAGGAGAAAESGLILPAGVGAGAGGAAAGSGIAATAGGVALGVGAGVILVQALSTGFNEGVDKALAKAKEEAPKLTAKGLQIAQGNQAAPPLNLGSAAAHGLNVVTGGAQPEELQQDIYQRTWGEFYLQQLKAVTSLKGFKNPKELLKSLGAPRGELISQEGYTNQTVDQADPTDNETFSQLKRLHDNLVKRYGKSYIDGVIKAANRTKNKFSTALASNNADAITSAGSDLSSSLKQQFETGNISYATYIEQLQSDIKGLQDVSSHSHGGTRKQDLQTLGKLIAQRSKATSDFLKSQIDFSSQLRDLTGSNSYSDSDLAQLSSVLANPSFTDPGDRSAVLAQVIAETKRKLQDDVNRLTTPAAKLARALQGQPLPAPAKLELAREYLDQALQGVGKISTELSQLAAATGTSVVDLENKAINIANFLGVSYSEGIRIVLNQMLARFRQRIAVLRLLQFTSQAVFHKKDKELTTLINGLKGDISAATDALKGLSSGPDIGQLAIPDVGIDTSSLEGQAAKAEDDLAKRIAIAQAGYAEAVAALDPVAAAQAAIHTADVTASFAKDEAEWWDAQAQRVRAEQQLQQAQLAITKLAIQLAGANTADPVKQANTQIQLAYASFLNAHGAAESIQAQIDITSAMRSLAAATAQIIESQIGLAQAVAAAAGDSVGAARDALKSLQVQLLAAAQSDAGPAALTNIRAQIVAAQASIRDASLAERESTIDFNLQVQRISTGQAISEYQALLNQAEILGLTEAQRRDLILKIQNLKHTLTQDLQFDLPTDLKLPTLYEARRLGQSGGNYQDNRTVTITLNSTDPASTEAAVSQINDAMNAPAVYGGSGRIY